MSDAGERRVRFVLLFLLLVVPLVPNPGWFTNSDDPKWAVLVGGTLLALLLVAGRALASTEKTRAILPEHLVALLIAAIAGLAMGPRAPDAPATLRALGAIGTLCALGIVASRYLTDGRWARRTYLVALAAGAAAAAVGIVQALTGARVTSTFGNPSFAAEYAAPALCLAVALFLMRKRATAAALAAPLLVLLALTKSRADWLGLAAGLAAMGLALLLTRLRWSPRASLVAGGVLLVSLVAPYVPDLVPLPLFGRSDTVEIRRLIRGSTLEMARDHPAAGVGLEGFRAVYPAYRSPEEARLSLRREVTFPHNLPLSVFAETGVPGLLLVLLLFWVTLWSGFRTVLIRPDDGIALGAIGAATAVLVSAQLSAPLRHPASALLFFLLAGLVAARRSKRFVTDLKGRYHRFVPVLLLAVPAIAAAVHLIPHLRADHHLAAAHSREVELRGGMDEEVVRRLERSVAIRPSPDGLHQLAVHANLSGKPQLALARLEELFRIAPHHELGRIERARALLIDGRAEKARQELDGLVAARPGDDVALVLRARARWSTEDDRGALADLLAALRAAPVESARRYAGWVDSLPPWFQDAVIDAAARLADSDPARTLAILSGVGNVEADYRRATVMVARGDLDGAMVILRARRPQLEPDRLRFDPRLDPLRSRADFRSLLEGE